MKKNRIFKTCLFLTEVIFVIIVGTSCKDRTEVPPTDLTNSTFFKTDQQFVSALGAAYGNLRNVGNYSNIFPCSEISSDEACLTQRGQDGYDGGQWITLQRHTWTPQHPLIRNLWNMLYGGINDCNRLIYQFDNLQKQGQIDQKTTNKFIAELKVLRSLYYYYLLDNFGNVPLVTKFENADKAPANETDFQTGRDKVYNFVEKEVKDNIQKLPRNVDQTTYGRMTVWGAHFLLAKLYLNAKVYIGKAHWEEAMAQCDSIINSGHFQLAKNFFDDFKTQNEGSPEFVFAVPFDQVFAHGFNIHMFTLHYASQKTFNLKSQPWNGFATLEDFYNSFDSTDVRKKGFLVGIQLSSTGDTLTDPNAKDPDGKVLDYTPHINELEPDAYREAGARFEKFEYATGATADLRNDFPLFRYADVLLMKAECQWRIDGAPDNYANSNALILVNMVRERAGLTDYNTLSAYKLLQERGHELYTETWRRQDLIRFRGGLHYKIDSSGDRVSQYPAGQTAFNDAWWEKAVDKPFHNVFPIPQEQLNANQNLHQNPGY